MLPESLIHICGHPVTLEEELRARFRQVYGSVSRAMDEALPADLQAFLSKYDSNQGVKRLSAPNTATTDTPTTNGRNTVAAHVHSASNNIIYEDGDMTIQPHLQPTNVTTTTRTVVSTAPTTAAPDLERELLEEVVINLTPEYCIRQRDKCVAAAEAVVAEFTCRREALIPSMLPE